MSTLRNRNNQKKGRPKRNNVTALQQHHLKENSLVSDTLFDLDINQPLTIVQLAAHHHVDNETSTVTERDSIQHPTNSNAASPCSSLTDAQVIAAVSFESSELSSEDDTISTSPPPPPAPAPAPPTARKVNSSQGVDLDQLPKVQFIKGDTLDEFNHDEEDQIYQQEQLAQEEQLLIQHYQLQQQYSSNSLSNSDILKQSRIYNRPENHYIHYNELSDVELYDSVEYDMDEQDQCWLKLYNRERRKEVLGDISPYLFECIMDKLEKEWFNLIKDAPKPEAEQVLLPEDSACVVCDDTEVENSNAIVFCDGCNVAVHQDCYGIPYIPEGQWLCRKCMISPEFPVSCIFCPNEGGAFKQTNTNQWGHLLCAIWIPEVGVSNTIYMEPIDQIENIPKSRWKLTCSLCRKRQGACIQCDNKHCFSAFHVTCAKAAKLCMNMNSQSSQSEGVILKAYCDKHTPKEYYLDHTAGSGRNTIGDITSSCSSSEEEEGHRGSSRAIAIPRTRGSRGGRGRGRGRGTGVTRGRGRPSNRELTLQQQQHIDEANNKVARAHQHHYSTGAPIAPDIILAKIDNLPCVRFSGIRKRPQAVTAIAHYWSLKRESRRGAPLLKRLHLEPWTAYSKYTGGENDYLIRKTVITQLRADLEKIRMLSEQVQKRERLKLEQTKKQKAYLEMILFPLEYVIRPILNQFMEIDRKKLFLNHVTIDDAADYRSIITQPMCFSEIYQKLANHSYATLDHFQNDIELIWKNSMDYNATDTSFYKVAIKLKNASAKLFGIAQEKLDYFENLQDGMLQEPIDDSIFSYDANFDQDALDDEQDQQPEVVDTEAETQRRLEIERLNELKEQERRRAIQARVDGRAKARALRDENKRKGILPVVSPAEQKAKQRTLRKLRTRNQQAIAQQNPAALKDEAHTTQAAVVSNSDSSLPPEQFVVIDTKEILTQASIEQQQPPPALHKHTAEQVYDLKVEQPVISPLINNVSVPYPSMSVTASDDSFNLPMTDLLENDIKAAVQAKEPEKEQSISSIKGKEKEQEQNVQTTMPIKRRQPSQRVTPRLTRRNGLKASIEELTKRRKISQEARTLFASYNGVSHLDRPVEVYKENRKIHAPIGWVYLDDDDDDEDDDEDEKSQSMETDGENEHGNDHGTASPAVYAKKTARHGRNDIPIPQFDRGQIVWARVNGFPSHPARFLNYSDEEAGNKLVASRRYTGDILVEFLKVPEMHRFGWVGRRTICDIGDAQTDMLRLKETLDKKMKKKEYIQEAKEGYREAGVILGLDPEPLLSKVFDNPPENKRKSKKRKLFHT